MRRAIGVGYRGRDIEWGAELMDLQSQSFVQSPRITAPASFRFRMKKPVSPPPNRRKGQNKRPLVEIEDFGLARRLADFSIQVRRAQPPRASALQALCAMPHPRIEPILDDGEHGLVFPAVVSPRDTVGQGMDLAPSM